MTRNYRQILEDRARDLQERAILQQREGKFDKSIQLFQEVLKLAEELKDPVAKIMTLINIGHVYLFKMEYDRATQHVQEALKLAVTINDQELMAQSLFKQGLIFEAHGEVDEASKCYEQVKKLPTKFST
jgi:tetratricopeptide (TPR) repeat protein